MFDKLERRGKLFGHEQSLRDEVRFSCCITCARPSTTANGPTAPCGASRANWAVSGQPASPVARRHHDQAPRKKAPSQQIDGLASASPSWPRSSQAPPLPTGLAPSSCRLRHSPSKKLGDIKRALELAVKRARSKSGSSQVRTFNSSPSARHASSSNEAARRAQSKPTRRPMTCSNK